MKTANVEGDLLKQVSRSFYLTLRVLPTAIRSQIGLAYLLARATDTIADTRIVSVETRLQALQSLRDRILGKRTAPLDFAEIARCQEKERESVRAWERESGQSGEASERRTSVQGADGTSAERILLERIEEILLLLDRFPDADRQLIRDVLQTITSGQTLDLTRFAAATAGQIVALQNDQELDDYTYRVAGCVGEFWTHLCRKHLFLKASMDDALLLANGVRFGKGLQLVNILRDLSADLRQGRCYLPGDRLQEAGLNPRALLDAATEPVFRPLYDEYLGRAQDHLAAGWAYTNALPRRCVRVRLACAWPLLIGERTLDRLRSGNVLDASHRIKIGRAEVRKLIASSLFCYPWPRAWDRLFFQKGLKLE